MASYNEHHIRMLEKKLQQNFNPPWAEPQQLRELKSLVTELADLLQQSLSEYIRESTPTNLAKVVVFCQKLKALGYHPTIIGEKKIPNGIQIFREDVWFKIQQMEAESGNTAVSNDAI
jgi:hypothetical protein